eukprot:699021_1
MSKHGSKRRHKMEPKQSYTGSIILSPESSVVSDGHHGGHPYVQYKKNLISQPMDRVSVQSHQSRNKRSKPSRHAPPMLQQSHPEVAFSDAASLNSISTSTSASHTYKSDAKGKVLSQQKLREKLQAARRMYQDKDKMDSANTPDTADTYAESYMSTMYTDETRSVFSETYTEASVTQSIFTDIDYDIDYNNVGIKDIVWTQKLKYLKNRLMFLEKEIADLPTTEKRLDKLMLYVALEFLSINPDEKKANDRLVEWWDIHKYSWIDKHDPHKENTLLSNNWNEIGVPLTRDSGQTPIHHDMTIFEEIYGNLRRMEWKDPFSRQHPLIRLRDKDGDADDHKSVIPSTVEFDESKYKDYDDEEEANLMDGNDFLDFLYRQTTGSLVRHKDGLVGYVNMTVEDKIAECTPWRLHRVFQTCALNRLGYAESQAFEMEIRQLKQELEAQQKQHEMEIEYFKNSKRERGKRSKKQSKVSKVSSRSNSKSSSSETSKSASNADAHNSGHMNRKERATATWKQYLSRFKQSKSLYPLHFADRNKAWEQWSKMLDERDANPSIATTADELWSYIDFARMSMSQYSNWIWWPEAARKEDATSLRNETQYYDHELKLIFTRKYGIVMDFNLFLFEKYATPKNIQQTLNFEHSLLSLASSTNVVKSNKNVKDLYLNTSGKNEARYLQFRCDDEGQRNEWVNELDYQITIVRDLLSIPNIKLEVADSNATVWLPRPSIK